MFGFEFCTETCPCKQLDLHMDWFWLKSAIRNILVYNVFGFDDADGESPQFGDIFRPITCEYAAAIFVIVPIDNVMAAVFDAAVALFSR